MLDTTPTQSYPILCLKVYALFIFFFFFKYQPLQVPDRRFSLLSAYSFNPGGSKHESVTASANLLREERQREEDLETVLDITGWFS